MEDESSDSIRLIKIVFKTLPVAWFLVLFLGRKFDSKNCQIEGPELHETKAVIIEI